MKTILSFLVLLSAPLQSICFHPTHRTSIVRSVVSLHALYDPQTSSDEFVEFPTASQRVELKKEASKRLARKELEDFVLSQEESFGPFSTETITNLWNALSENELVQVRGIAREERKLVFGIAERICAELELLQEELPVSLLSTKGHTALLYSPTLPTDHNNHVTLRTSVGQKNTWRPRPKPLRDSRGQVIKKRSEMG